METLKMNITNMVSTHCQMTVKRIVEKFNGTEVTNLQPGEIEVKLDTGKASLNGLIGAVEDAGYQVKKLINK